MKADTQEHLNATVILANDAARYQVLTLSVLLMRSYDPNAN